MSTLKILLIAYSYPPLVNPRAFRWSAIAHELASRGHFLDVVTSASKHDSIKDEISNIKVHRAIDIFSSSRAVVKNNNKSKKIINILSKYIWVTFRWPDYAFGWIMPGYLKCKELLNSGNSYDWVISSSHPFTTHLVGLIIKRDLCNTKWLVDIGDPFSLMKEPRQNSRLYHYLNYMMERLILKYADCISVTTIETKELYSQFFKNKIEKKIHVIPPLLSLNDLTRNNIKRVDNIIKITFTGTLYKKLRSPATLIKIFNRLLDLYQNEIIELHFYGSINDCEDYFQNLSINISSQIQIHGIVSRDEVQNAMIDSDLLVNIGNTSKYQLTSKLIEYISLQKPILNISNCNDDCSISVLENYNNKILVNYSDLPPIDKICHDIMGLIKYPKYVDEKIINEYKEIYSAGRITSEYLNIMSKNKLNG